jgi:hypothetical protein
MDQVAIEKEVSAELETAMVSFCKTHEISQGWSVAQHAKFQLGLVMDVVDSGDAITPEEAKFRIFLILRKLANYSAWRQAHEGEGQPLKAGSGKKSANLASEYAQL